MSTSEPESTEHRLDTLQLRVQSLEASIKQLKWIRTALLGLLLLMAIGTWWIALKVRSELDVNSITARRSYLRDEIGAVTAAWEQNEDHVRLILKDRKGHIRLGMAVNKDGPFMGFSDDTPRRRLQIDAYQGESASVHIFDDKAKERCNFGINEHGPGVRLMNEGGKVQVGLLQIKDEGTLLLSDAAGNTVIDLTVGKKDGTISLQDVKGKTRLELGLKGDNAGIKIMDEAGKTLFEQP